MKMKMKMRERGSMSEPDLASRFGHIGVCFESGTQAVAEAEAGSSHSKSTGGCVGIVQQLHDGEDGEDDEDACSGPIQIRIKVRP